MNNLFIIIINNMINYWLRSENTQMKYDNNKHNVLM